MGQGQQIAALARAAGVNGGRVGVLVRAPQLNSHELAALLATLAPQVRLGGLCLGLNVGGCVAQADVAELCALIAPWAPDWLQVPERAAPLVAWRQAMTQVDRATTLLCRSCHDVEGMVTAFDEGADWVMVSPVLATPGKLGVNPLGIASLGHWVGLARGPLIALGGIDASTAMSCLKQGVAGVAVMRAAWSQDGGQLIRRCLDHSEAPR